MDRKLLFLEIAGGAFVACGSLFMRQLYTLCGGELLGILFGAVNGSMWEACKTLLLPYLLWSVLETLTLRLRVHRFTVVKALALYTLGFVYLSLRVTGCADLFASAVAMAAATLWSLFLYHAGVPLRWLFAPSLVLLFLFAALYCSLTPFPPHTALFFDKATGMYGIIPRSYDCGAAALGAFFHSRNLF